MDVTQDLGNQDVISEFNVLGRNWAAAGNQGNQHQIAVEATDGDQDWIGQWMVSLPVRLLKERLEYSDVQIRNGLRELCNRGIDITFASLYNIISQTADVQVSFLVGLRRYALSADVEYVLQECHRIYDAEPTVEQFNLEYNRIKGTGIVHLQNEVAVKDLQLNNLTREQRRMVERDRVRTMLLVQEQNRADQEQNRADRESNRADQEQNRADRESNRADWEERERIRAAQQLQEEKVRAGRAEQKRIEAQEEKERLQEENRMLVRRLQQMISVS